MNNIKTILVDSAIKNYTIHNNVLQYTNESTEAKVERFIGLLYQIKNVL